MSVFGQIYLPDEINKVMENPILREKLIKYAKDLITNSSSKKPTLSITLDKLSNEDSIDEKNEEVVEESEDEEIVESDEEKDEESDEESVDDSSSEEIEVIEDDEATEDESSEEEVSCKQIYTNDGRFTSDLLYLVPRYLKTSVYFL